MPFTFHRFGLSSRTKNGKLDNKEKCKNLHLKIHKQILKDRQKPNNTKSLIEKKWNVAHYPAVN